MAVMDFDRWFAAYKRSNPRAKKTSGDVMARYVNYTATQQAADRHNATLANPAAYGYSTPDTPQRIADPNWKPASDEDIANQIRRASGQVVSRRTGGNLQRKSDASDFQRDMVDEGYWMPTTGNYYTKNTATGDANDAKYTARNYGALAAQESFSYNAPSVAAEGALFRQMYQKQLADMAATGQAGTSSMERGWRQAHRGLEATRQGLMRDAASEQRKSLITENDQMWNNTDSLFSNLLSGEKDQRDHRAAQVAPIVANPNYRPYVAPTSATRDFTNSQSYGFDPNRTTLNSRFGAGNYSVGRNGNKWVVRW